MRDGTSINIDLRSGTEWYSFYSGSYDDAIIDLIVGILKKIDGNFLDVGGNIGMYSVRVAARLEQDRRSVCFEPMPNNVSRIQENAELNGVGERVIVNAFALSDQEGEAELVLREDFERGANTGNASIAISDEADQGFKKIRVQTSKFDDVRARTSFGSLPVAKVDIEGHEDFFLSGAKGYLAHDRPIILTEINNWYYKRRGTTSSAVFSRTLPADYQAVLFKKSGSAHILKKIQIEELAEFQGVETCIFYPEEKKFYLD
jgi:FkbM family methyltransferase